MQLEEEWHIENGKIFNTTEIFSKLIVNEINKDLYCWNNNNIKELIGKRFGIVDNKYGLVDYLGEGMCGTVYLGFDITGKQTNKRLVAIKQPTNKILHNYAQLMGYQTNPQEPTDKNHAIQWAKLELGQKFSEESLLIGRLSLCENVVSIIDHNIRIPYIVLEYCNEGSLKNRMKMDYTSEDIENWAQQIAKALDAAHSLKPDMLIHRDLKPDNILINNKIIKISDFGTSIMKQENESIHSLQGGYTPKYAAPEAFAGKAYPQTDIWSLGVILYELITKEAPFTGKNIPELIQNILMTKPCEIEKIAKYQVSPKLKTLIMKSLEKETSSRPQAKEYLQKKIDIQEKINFSKGYVKKSEAKDQECFSALNIEDYNIQNDIKTQIEILEILDSVDDEIYEEKNKNEVYKKTTVNQDKMYIKILQDILQKKHTLIEEIGIAAFLFLGLMSFSIITLLILAVFFFVSD